MPKQAPSSPVDAGGELFALSDEQILNIPTEDAAPSGADRASDSESAGQRVSTNSQSEHAEYRTPAPSNARTDHEPRATGHDSIEPPAWLAAQMQDPWGGEEAREFWDGVRQARSEAAAYQVYRAAIASPEDARALKELYPGGVSEARAAAERARLLDEVDRAYFGAAGNSAQQTSASRAQLAQRMMRDDPAAFREMVETGIRVLREASGAQGQQPKSLASALSGEGNSSGATDTSTVGAQRVTPQLDNGAAHEAQVAAYAAFERAANEDLERSVGSTIERTLAQALPSFEQYNTPGQSSMGAQTGAQQAAPLQQRLAASVRAEVEKALQGDRQLGDQVAQILASRRFDHEARAQIVRLIGERAQQLVPGAAKRVLNDWTQTTLAAHRGRTQRADPASVRADVAQTSTSPRPTGSEQISPRRQDSNVTKTRTVNYRKLSDEQILDL